MTARHVPVGIPVHDAEARGIQALVRALPDNYWVFSNLDLASDRRGQTFDHDAIVVAPHAVFTVELKSWGGRISGNRDRWLLADGTTVPSPIPLILAKARILKGRMQSRQRDLGSVWVQGLVFLSAPDASAQITRDFEDYVVTLDTVRRTLTDPEWLGHPTPITPTQRRAIDGILRDGHPTRVQNQLEDFRLVQRLAAEGRPFEAWLAERTSLTRERRVLHAYAIDCDTEAERDRLRAHALREATLHSKLRGGRDILRYDTYFVTRDDPQRIVLQFEDTTPLQPLDAWSKDKNPGLHARLSVAARIARALAWVHEKNLVHRRLSPEAVLVSAEDVPVELRLCAFELARDLTGALATVTSSPLGDPTFRYAAPEALRTGEATPRSDLFSLGATLVELFTGRSLFANVDEVLRPFTVPPLYLGDRPVPRGVADLVASLLATDASARPDGAASVADALERALREYTQQPARVEVAPGEVLRGTYELLERLGRGATATTWKARQLQTDHLVVLKIADGDHAHYLQEEGRVLAAVHHPNLVRFHNVEPFEGGNLLVLEYVDGFTATLWAAAGDPLDAARFLTVARGLLGALAALHRAGWVHRDVKPDNLMLSETDATPKLLDLGLAAHLPVVDDLAVGSIRYKDPLVYVDGRWAPTNDVFSAALVLYELLTGTHPFGGSSPEPNQSPTIQPDEFPDGYAPGVVKRLEAWFKRALSPVAAERPRDASAAVLELEQAVGVNVTTPPSTDGTPHARPLPNLLPVSAELGTKLAALEISTRAEGALARLGLAIVADLVGFDVALARGLPNVGSKTIRELAALVAEVATRWPEQQRSERPPTERFYPALADDLRPLDALGRDLTQGLKAALLERSVFTIGDLASLPPPMLAQLPSVGPEKLARLRTALRRLAGREPMPETLAELDHCLEEEVGKPAWAAISLVVGSGDGTPHTQAEAAVALGISRQRVSQAVDLQPLRAEASWGRHLVNVLVDALPPAGFATLETAAAALTTRLPAAADAPRPIGYARLATLLLRPDARASDGADLRWALRPPWTMTQLVELQQRLGAMAQWPPIQRADAEARLWDAMPTDLQRALVRWGADAAQLLDRLLQLDDHVLLDRVGGLYTPPIELSAAIAVRRPALRAVLETETLLAEVQAAYHGVAVPNDATELILAIERGGYRRDGDRWVDPRRIEEAGHEVTPRVDASIPTQHVSSDRRPPVVATLAAQIDRGGFRVVALAPAVHHILARRLHAWLGEVVGGERVQFVPVDRLVIDALKAADLWKYVPYLEPRPDADWRMFHAEVAAALDAAVADARPGIMTMLGQPSLLGPLGLMDWLSGFYERARGGKHGLIVLAVPGGIHEDRVRLNEKYNLPYTPDMAAIYLEAAAR